MRLTYLFLGIYVINIFWFKALPIIFFSFLDIFQPMMSVSDNSFLSLN